MFARRVSSPGVRLNHITLPVADVESSAGFYVRLGLEQIVASYPDYARFRSPQGDVTLSLHRAEQRTGSPRASIHFEVEDVDQTVEQLKQDGFTFVCDPVDQPYLWREAIMLDPDDHHIFIYHVSNNAASGYPVVVFDLDGTLLRGTTVSLLLAQWLGRGEEIAELVS
jgi:catechol 2,3-dioxygenase-like lactoylglutathione lyase family enzyme